MLNEYAKLSGDEHAYETVQGAIHRNKTFSNGRTFPHLLISRSVVPRVMVLRNLYGEK